MILVLFGTNPYKFDRLANAISKLANEVDEKIVVQAGKSRIESDKVEQYAYVDYELLSNWLSEARVIIAQGGFGSIRDAVRAGKPVLAVARRKEYSECQDDQDELVDQLEKIGVVSRVNDLDNLGNMVMDVGKVKHYANKSRISEDIRKYIYGII